MSNLSIDTVEPNENIFRAKYYEQIVRGEESLTIP